MPKAFEEYFHSDAIVGLLVRKRIAECQLARKAAFFNGICGIPSNSTRREVAELENLHFLLPPRKFWPRPLRHHRHDAASDGPTAQARTLSRYVRRCLKRPPATKDFRWLKNLRAFIGNIQTRAFDWHHLDRYEYKDIRVAPKKGKTFQSGCRILAIYNLADTILASCFAAYLREQIDHALDPDSLAFRPPRNGKIPSHHDAIDRIFDYKAAVGDFSPIYVAECDIRGFFDSVSHDVIVLEIARLCHEHDILLDERFWKFLASFLNGYSYTREGILNAVLKLAALRVKGCEPFNPKTALQKLRATPDPFHGIPQGSALSCILANIVLARADASVRATAAADSTGSHLYLRYCDDIVVASTTKATCDSAIEKYISTLANLKLPYHPLKRTRFYNASFWKRKSKHTYEWREGGRNSSPWLAFVGYQIHRDGRIRIRKGSIQKERDKQTESAQEVVRRLNVRVSGAEGPVIVPRGVLYRLLLHLVSFGVGTPSGTRAIPSPNSKSWIAGFIALRGRKVDVTGLRHLDQNRSKSLSRVRKHVAALMGLQRIRLSPPSGASKAFLDFAGRPFSYAYQGNRPRSTSPS